MQQSMSADSKQLLEQYVGETPDQYIQIGLIMSLINSLPDYGEGDWPLYVVQQGDTFC